MSSFSGILDVSSFFIGVLVNLLLVAMICFYFKRKIDNLELSQSEQAKILFQIVQEQSKPQQSGGSPSEMYPVLNGLDLTQLGESEESDTVQAQQGNEEESESESESESDENDSDGNDSDENEDVEMDIEKDVEVKKIDYEELKQEDFSDDYSKYTVKELRSLLENKGVSLHSRAMKKQELIDLISSTNAQVIEEVVKVEETEEMEEVENDIEESTPLVQPPEISDINE